MGDPHGDLEVVDLTQDDDPVSMRGQGSGAVDLSQLSSSDEEDVREGRVLRASNSPERPARSLSEAKSLYRRGTGISKLLEMERALRNGLLQRQEPIATTTGRSLTATGPSAMGTTSAEMVGTATSETMTSGTRTCSGTRKRTKSVTTVPKSSSTASKKDEAALRKIQKEFDSEKHVLKFIKVLLSPALMCGAVGLGIGQAFQQTADKADHEHIGYEVSTSSSSSSHPLIRWKRMVPSVGSLGEFEEVMEPFAMLCLDADALVELLLGTSGQGMDAVLDGLREDHRLHATGSQDTLKIYVLVHRLEQHIAKREAREHREAVSGTASPRSRFQGDDVRQVLSDLIICHPYVEVFDAGSVEEASSHVSSITKAIALRGCESQGCASKSKYIAGKSRKQQGAGGALSSVLLKDPLPEHAICAVRALTAIPSVTPQIAHTLVKEYGSLRGVYEFLDDRESDLATKKRLLENLRTFGGQRVGPVAARKLVDFLLADDPEMMIS